jgi:hypothetical protein
LPLLDLLIKYKLGTCCKLLDFRNMPHATRNTQRATTTHKHPPPGAGPQRESHQTYCQSVPSADPARAADTDSGDESEVPLPTSYAIEFIAAPSKRRAAGEVSSIIRYSLLFVSYYLFVISALLALLEDRVISGLQFRFHGHIVHSAPPSPPVAPTGTQQHAAASGCLAAGSCSVAAQLAAGSTGSSGQGQGQGQGLGAAGSWQLAQLSTEHSWQLLAAAAAAAAAAAGSW